MPDRLNNYFMVINEAIRGSLNKWLNSNDSPNSPSIPGKINYARINSAGPIEIKPNSLPYHQERGWTCRNNSYSGYYRCKYGAWKGLITKNFGAPIKFYIFDPPKQVFSGTHSACFTSKDGYRYHIHFQVDSQSIDSGILSVERTIFESIENTRRH